MDYNQSNAAKGAHHGYRNRHLYYRSAVRAAVNVYKTDNSYEMLLFAPGRIKEHFKLDVKGNELFVSYTPPEGFARPEWIIREYSRGGFERAFALDENVDKQNITAKYQDGVLYISMPLVAGKETVKQEITIN
jgi:HSP20 family protein